MVRTASLALLALLSADVPAFAEAPTIDAVDAVVEPHVGRDAPGIAVLVTREGEVIHMKGYGLADLETETPVDEDTIFDLASVSKEMTALAAMILIEEGVFAPDTEISAILPAFADAPGDERALVVSDLVHHVSGLADYLDDEGLDYQAETTNAEVVAWAAGQELERPPGTAFDYSNTGYLVLGSLVAAADGADSLKDVLKARVWNGLGMEHTGLVVPVDPDAVVTGYKGSKGSFEPSSSPTVTEGDGNVLTSLADLALYEKGLATNAILDAEATARLFADGTFDDGSPVRRDDDPEAGYGYGWTLEEYEGARYADHGGSWMGTATYYQRNLDTGVTVIVLANGEDMDCDDLAVDVEAALED